MLLIITAHYSLGVQSIRLVLQCVTLKIEELELIELYKQLLLLTLQEYVTVRYKTNSKKTDKLPVVFHVAVFIYFYMLCFFLAGGIYSVWI